MRQKPWLWILIPLLAVGCALRGGPADPVSEQYRVWKEYIRATHPDVESVLVRTALSDHEAGVQVAMSSTLPDGTVKRDTMEDEVKEAIENHEMVGNQAPLQADRFGLSPSIELMGAEDFELYLRTWHSFRLEESRYSDDKRPLLQFSPVGFSSDGTVAFFFATEFSGHVDCFGGGGVLMRKERGKWTVSNPKYLLIIECLE